MHLAHARRVLYIVAICVVGACSRAPTYAAVNSPTASAWASRHGLRASEYQRVVTSGEFAWAAIANTRDQSPAIDPMMWTSVNGVSAWPEYDLFP